MIENPSGLDAGAKDANAKIIENVLLEHVKQARRSGRWSVFFRTLLFCYLGIGLFFFHQMKSATEINSDRMDTPHVAVIDVRGAIADDPRVSASADRVGQGLRRAFAEDNVKAIILRINSPGGSPVQSSIIYREIQRLKAQHPDKPIYAVGGDIVASGGYYIASAVDEIYTDSNTLVGSIGVIMGGFGFSNVMEKVGVERRVYTAGNSKAFMDPFMPESSEALAHAESLLGDIHDNFINAVKNGRGDRLNASDDELFNGLIWTGSQALELGLIDGIMGTRELAVMKFGDDVRLMSYSVPVSPLERFINRIGASLYNAYHVESSSLSIR